MELFLNGKSFGVKSLEFPRQGTAGGWNSYARPQQPTGTTADLHLSWDVPYESGTLKAVGYRYGREVCVEEVRTTGEPWAEKARFENAVNAWAKPFKILFEAPLLNGFDFLGRERRMFDHRAEAICSPVEQVLVGGVVILQQVLLDDPFVERRAGHRAVDEKLRE